MSLDVIYFTKTSVALAAFIATALGAAPAMAYVGPGVGLTAIGTMVAVIAVVVFAVIGFLWYPLKRVLRRHNQHKTERPE